MFRRHFIGLITLVAVLGTNPFLHAWPDSSEPWAPSDGEVLDFKVTRNGSPFGHHTVSFEVTGDELTVRNDIELKVAVGPVRLFYYRHESTEKWSDSKLTTLNGKTRKDGDSLAVSVSRAGDALLIDGTGFKGSAPASLIPSSHWNIEEVRSEKMLSSEDGTVLDISVEIIGEETLTIGGADVVATRYRLASALSVDLWYDQNGKWVKAQFEARGQTIEYTLAPTSS